MGEFLKMILNFFILVFRFVVGGDVFSKYFVIFLKDILMILNG